MGDIRQSANRAEIFDYENERQVGAPFDQLPPPAAAAAAAAAATAAATANAANAITTTATAPKCAAIRWAVVLDLQTISRQAIQDHGCPSRTATDGA